MESSNVGREEVGAVCPLGGDGVVVGIGLMSMVDGGWVGSQANLFQSGPLPGRPG